MGEMKLGEEVKEEKEWNMFRGPVDGKFTCSEETWMPRNSERSQKSGVNCTVRKLITNNRKLEMETKMVLWLTAGQTCLVER